MFFSVSIVHITKKYCQAYLEQESDYIKRPICNHLKYNIIVYDNFFFLYILKHVRISMLFNFYIHLHWMMMEHYFPHILGCYISPTFCHKYFFSCSFKKSYISNIYFWPYLLASKCYLLYFRFFITCLWFLKYFTGRLRLFNVRFHCDNIPHNWGQKVNKCLINGIHFWGNNCGNIQCKYFKYTFVLETKHKK